MNALPPNSVLIIYLVYVLGRYKLNLRGYQENQPAQSGNVFITCFVRQVSMETKYIQWLQFPVFSDERGPTIKIQHTVFHRINALSVEAGIEPLTLSDFDETCSVVS